MPFYGAIVIIKRDGRDGSRFPLTAKECLIGSGQNCDIRVRVPSVADEHCEIVVTETKEVRIRNKVEENPASINNEHLLVGVDAKLNDGDMISIGDRYFRFELTRPPSRRSSTSRKLPKSAAPDVDGVRRQENGHKSPARKPKARNSSSKRRRTAESSTQRQVAPETREEIASESSSKMEFIDETTPGKRNVREPSPEGEPADDTMPEKKNESSPEREIISETMSEKGNVSQSSSPLMEAVLDSSLGQQGGDEILQKSGGSRDLVFSQITHPAESPSQLEASVPLLGSPSAPVSIRSSPIASPPLPVVGKPPEANSPPEEASPSPREASPPPKVNLSPAGANPPTEGDNSPPEESSPLPEEARLPLGEAGPPPDVASLSLQEGSPSSEEATPSPEETTPPPEAADPPPDESSPSPAVAGIQPNSTPPGVCQPPIETNPASAEDQPMALIEANPAHNVEEGPTAVRSRKYTAPKPTVQTRNRLRKEPDSLPLACPTSPAIPPIASVESNHASSAVGKLRKRTTSRKSTAPKSTATIGNNKKREPSPPLLSDTNSLSLGLGAARQNGNPPPAMSPPTASIASDPATEVGKKKKSTAPRKSTAPKATVTTRNRSKQTPSSPPFTSESPAAKSLTGIMKPSTPAMINPPPAANPPTAETSQTGDVAGKKRRSTAPRKSVASKTTVTTRSRSKKEPVLSPSTVTSSPSLGVNPQLEEANPLEQSTAPKTMMTTRNRSKQAPGSNAVGDIGKRRKSTAPRKTTEPKRMVTTPDRNAEEQSLACQTRLNGRRGLRQNPPKTQRYDPVAGR